MFGEDMNRVLNISKMRPDPEENKYQKEMILLKLHHTVSTTLLPSGINGDNQAHITIKGYDKCNQVGSS